LTAVRAEEAPRVIEKDGRYAFLVDGKPYLALGGQIHNSSAWPSELPQVWESMAALHANTIEAPVYWEQIETQPGKFDFSNVDALVEGARAHNLRMVLLWFGTWKNGNMHYVPAWVKQDTKRFPRVIRADGEPIDVLSPMSRNTLEADKAAFVALMRHLKEIDGERHTVIAMQVENESGNVGSVRDYSQDSNREIAGLVPPDLLAATGKHPGTWSQVFGAEADEVFQAYHQAKYINEIAAAGKREFAIPCYINVWLDYPAAQLAQRQLDQAGIAYPSGGAVQKLVGLWRKLAPSLDMIGPDIYSDDSGFYRDTMKAYHRADNPLWIPETGRSDSFGKYFFYALEESALGFAPFGVDRSGWNILGDEQWESHARNFSLIAPMAREIAQMEFDGQVKTAVEELGQATQEVDFGDWQVTVTFGFPQMDGRRAPGTKDAHGAALIARLGPDEFLVTGVDASVVFHLPGKQPWIRSQFLTVEQGAYDNGNWKPVRLWNGDETDRGLCFYKKPIVVRAKMEKF
jgi:beta-galactosidase GanA